jgi:small subunit ribosomal protein S6
MVSIPAAAEPISGSPIPSVLVEIPVEPVDGIIGTGARAPRASVQEETELREYETTIIVQPEISEEGTSAIFEKLEGILEKNDSHRLLCENLGKRKLAYEIRKFQKGHYYVLAFLSEGKEIPELERALRLDESILRFMTIQVSPLVKDIEARKADAKEQEAEQERRAAERAAREIEEAKARAEVERVAAEEAAATAAAAAAEEARAAAAADAATEAVEEAGPDADAAGASEGSEDATSEESSKEASDTEAAKETPADSDGGEEENPS